MQEPEHQTSLFVCSAHAEVIPSVLSRHYAVQRLLRTRGGDPLIGAAFLPRRESAPHTRR